MPFHNVHVDDLGLDCTACHAAEEGAPAGDNRVALSQRPYHTACADCHEEIAAAEEDGPRCKVCHTAPVELDDWPSGEVVLGKFSHAKHVDPNGRVNKETGVRQDCTFCHAAGESGGNPSRPNHPQCGSCHAGANAVSPVIDLKGDSKTCLGCHSLDRIEAHLTARRLGQPQPPSAADAWANPRGRVYRDIVPLPHARHVQRRDGAAIDCVTCHAAILGQTDVAAATAVPAMTDCQKCHDNASFVGGKYLTKECRVCHTSIEADSLPGPAEPVSRDIVHNPSFRRFHNVAAERDDAVCGSCHREVVNVGTDKCAGCHSSMQPKSHLALRWNEQWHGRQVAFDRMQCTTCHTADFCSQCHDQVMPRSHVPLNSFIAGGHRRAAALNIRACFTCHQFETTCQECHSEQLR
jgi:Zn finger protein HypA/HybF involved in hydrogenase expression